eukprot:Sspe_Gene.72809::Locus_43621_Transcript_1_1_Confidence_1.000_Length_7296::g.72809::m.72809
MSCQRRERGRSSCNVPQLSDKNLQHPVEAGPDLNAPARLVYGQLQLQTRCPRAFGGWGEAAGKMALPAWQGVVLEMHQHLHQLPPVGHRRIEQRVKDELVGQPGHLVVPRTVFLQHPQTHEGDPFLPRRILSGLQPFWDWGGRRRGVACIAVGTEVCAQGQAVEGCLPEGSGARFDQSITKVLDQIAQPRESEGPHALLHSHKAGGVVGVVWVPPVEEPDVSYAPCAGVAPPHLPSDHRVEANVQIPDAGLSIRQTSHTDQLPPGFEGPPAVVLSCEEWKTRQPGEQQHLADKLTVRCNLNLRPILNECQPGTVQTDAIPRVHQVPRYEVNVLRRTCAVREVRTLHHGRVRQEEVDVVEDGGGVRDLHVDRGVATRKTRGGFPRLCEACQVHAAPRLLTRAKHSPLLSYLRWSFRCWLVVGVGLHVLGDDCRVSHVHREACRLDMSLLSVLRWFRHPRVQHRGEYPGSTEEGNGGSWSHLREVRRFRTSRSELGLRGRAFPFHRLPSRILRRFPPQSSPVFHACESCNVTLAASLHNLHFPSLP